MHAEYAGVIYMLETGVQRVYLVGWLPVCSHTVPSHDRIRLREPFLTLLVLNWQVEAIGFDRT